MDSLPRFPSRSPHHEDEPEATGPEHDPDPPPWAAPPPWPLPVRDDPIAPGGWRAGGILDGERGRWLRAHRRVLLAALAVAMTVAFSLLALAPSAHSTVPVLVATRDLPGGARLVAADVRTAPLPADEVPEGSIPERTSTVGWVLAAPVRRGEPLTDVRFLGPSLLGGYGADGMVAAPVRIADPGVVRLVQAGNLVDVFGAAPDAAHGPPGAGCVPLDARNAARLAALNGERSGPLPQPPVGAAPPTKRGTTGPAPPPAVAPPSTPGAATPSSAATAAHPPDQTGPPNPLSTPQVRNPLGPPGCGARLIVHAARVVLVPHDGSHSPPTDDGTGALVVLAVSPPDATALAGAQTAGALSVALLPS